MGSWCTILDVNTAVSNKMSHAFMLRFCLFLEHNYYFALLLSLFFHWVVVSHDTKFFILSLQLKATTLIFRRYLSFSEIVAIALLFKYPFSINYSFLCEQNSAVLIISIQNSNLAPQGVIRYQKFLVAEKSHGNHGLHKIYNIP